ncbi:hypothetical protein ES703_76697 [subsurface metagenome]
MFGFVDLPKSVVEGEASQGVWMKSKEDAAKFWAQMPRLPLERYKAIVISPLASGRLDAPDVVLLLGNPAQTNLLLNALQWEDYNRLVFYFFGEGSCVDYLVECFLSGKPQLTVPCLGERMLGHIQDDEMEIAIPANMVEKALVGLQSLHAARTIRYPIPILGPQADLFLLVYRFYSRIPQYREAITRGERLDYT